MKIQLLGEASCIILTMSYHQIKIIVICIMYISDPVTDPGKKSKRGRLVLIKKEGEYQTVRQEETNQEDEMFTVFENGHLVKASCLLCLPCYNRRNWPLVIAVN